MKLYDTLTGDHATQFCQNTLQLTSGEIDLGKISRVEVFGTELSDPGDDYCEFKIFYAQDKLLAIRREVGY